MLLRDVAMCSKKAGSVCRCRGEGDEKPMKNQDTTSSNDAVGMHHYWVVGFFDILGQKQAMREIDFVPDQKDPEQMDRFVAGVKRSYGAVKFIHETFEEWTNLSERTEPQFLKLSEDQLKIWRKTTGTKIKFQRFSDGLMIYLSLHDYEEHSPAASIFSLLGGSASVLLGSLAAETPIRGGIDVGVGMEMTPNELYGPVLTKAYELESKTAQYPRVVVGDQFIHYLQTIEQSDEKGPKAEFEKQMARVCLDMIMIDVDGRPTVDFLGGGFRRHIARNLDSECLVMAHNFIIQQLEKHKAKRDIKLALRYSLLLDYFEAKLPLWNSCEQEHDERGNSPGT